MRFGQAFLCESDLSGIDFDKLADLFAASPKVAAERLREEAEDQARALAQRNPTRVQLVERLEKLVAEYNAGSIDAERFFEALKAFIGDMGCRSDRDSREHGHDRGRRRRAASSFAGTSTDLRNRRRGLGSGGLFPRDQCCPQKSADRQ